MSYRYVVCIGIECLHVSLGGKALEDDCLPSLLKTGALSIPLNSQILSSTLGMDAVSAPGLSEALGYSEPQDSDQLLSKFC